MVLAEIISTLKMEAICSSETSVATQQTTWRHIPEYDTLLSKLLHFIKCPKHHSYSLRADLFSTDEDISRIYGPEGSL
jgi:hypothetical protein